MAGSRIVKDQVKQNASAHQRFGYLVKSIGVKVRVFQDRAVGIIGPRSNWFKEVGVRKRGKHVGEPIRYRPSYYAHLVEKGSKKSKAHPFLEPALASTLEQYIEIVTTSIQTAIANHLSKS